MKMEKKVVYRNEMSISGAAASYVFIQKYLTFAKSYVIRPTKDTSVVFQMFRKIYIDFLGENKFSIGFVFVDQLCFNWVVFNGVTGAVFFIKGCSVVLEKIVMNVSPTLA